PLTQRPRVVDAHQNGASRDGLPADHRDLTDAAIDAGGKIHAGGVDLALNEQRLGPNQIPDRQRNDGDDDTRDNNRWRASSDWFLDGCSLRVPFALATSL